MISHYKIITKLKQFVIWNYILQPIIVPEVEKSLGYIANKNHLMWDINCGTGKSWLDGHFSLKTEREREICYATKWSSPNYNCKTKMVNI